MTRLLDGRHHLERFAMEQAGEMDYLITRRDNEFVGRVSLTPCRPRACGCESTVLRIPENRLRASGCAYTSPPS